MPYKDRVGSRKVVQEKTDYRSMLKRFYRNTHNH